MVAGEESKSSYAHRKGQSWRGVYAKSGYYAPSHCKSDCCFRQFGKSEII